MFVLCAGVSEKGQVEKERRRYSISPYIERSPHAQHSQQQKTARKSEDGDKWAFHFSGQVHRDFSETTQLSAAQLSKCFLRESIVPKLVLGNLVVARPLRY